MKKFQITSHTFSGKVDVMYDNDGNLFYFSAAGMQGSTKTLSVLLRLLPLKLGPTNYVSAIFKMEEVKE